MEPVTLKPENELDAMIVAAKRGGRPKAEMMSAMLKCYLYIGSRAQPAEDGTGFDPLMMDHEEGPLAAAYSAGSHALLHSEAAPWVLRMPAVDFLRRIPAGVGIVLNPGYDVQLIMPAPAIADLRLKVLKALDEHNAKTAS